MYCSSCGEEIQETGQKYCSNCGAEIITTPKANYYNEETLQPEATQKIQYAPVRPQGDLPEGATGKYSKMCLALALISIGVGIVSLIIGYNSLRFYSWPYMGARIVVIITMVLLRVGGLIMGIFSKVNSSKAERFEPYNDVEKAGSIFGIFGIIINGIGLYMAFNFLIPYIF